ncbi:MAG: hypothetical protein A2X36_14445 [Elusimicrobia bacterium GWA2_69_24]|nr:MAG: hypothetical protein A2X36_14445 [Elusimicrobia bacterium GWA2_69_24]HBL18408.1 hypothetical protein [Elusimicrobiota bacterium]
MDKKLLIALGVVLLIGSIGLLYGLLVLLKPESLREADQAGSAAFNFPAAGQPSTEPAPPASNEAARLKADPVQGSSLNFLKGSGAVGGPGGGAGFGASPEAEGSAAAGDAKGVIQGLTGGKGPGQGLSNSDIREVMQFVVDTVHSAQPDWYDAFLEDENLKAIADRYDREKDFIKFIRFLGTSKPFHRMLKKHSAASGMRALTKRLLTDRQNGPLIQRVFEEKGKDEFFAKLVSYYGSPAGLPAKFFAYCGLEAGAPPAEAGPPGSRTAAKGGARPRLKEMSGGGFTGFHKPGAEDQGSAPSGKGGGNSADLMKNLPAGVDPEMLQQYMGKKK